MSVGSESTGKGGERRVRKHVSDQAAVRDRDELHDEGLRAPRPPSKAFESFRGVRECVSGRLPAAAWSAVTEPRYDASVPVRMRGGRMAEEKKRSKKGLLTALLAIVGGVFFFMKKKRGRAGEESGWEEAAPNP